MGLEGSEWSKIPQVSCRSQRKVWWAHRNYVEELRVVTGSLVLGRVQGDWETVRSGNLLALLFYKLTSWMSLPRLRVSIKGEVLGVEPRLNEIGQWGSKRKRVSVNMWALKRQICKSRRSQLLTFIVTTLLFIWTRTQLQTLQILGDIYFIGKKVGLG